MKTHTMDSAIGPAMEWSRNLARDSRVVRNSTQQLRGALRLATRAVPTTRSWLALASALSSALAILIAAAWLVDLPGAAIYLQATLGAGGFVFLALAIDSESPQTALLQLATGIALPALAWLSSREAVEIALVASALVAVWVAAGIFRR